MQQRTVEESTLWEVEVGDGVTDSGKLVWSTQETAHLYHSLRVKTETIVFHGRFSDHQLGSASGKEIASPLDTGAKAAIKFRKLALFIS
jgi:hypothetical protein